MIYKKDTLGYDLFMIEYHYYGFRNLYTAEGIILLDSNTFYTDKKARYDILSMNYDTYELFVDVTTEYH